ncbi:hypothetical protein WKI71_39405 [Streptomyces sp. MS1.AVA.1]|uniref:Uncharacterized protein n=1 Tax=Streptomyces machairae TaxID=3134109 RepID=A0ABU8UTJ8_9ACTN
MNDFLIWACVLGPVLLAEGLLARYEVLVYSAGFRAPTSELPEGVPYARGADADRPPEAYLVYLDGIGKRRVRDTRDGGQLVKAVLAAAPELRVLGQVQPYSPLADPLADRPVWAWLRRRVGLLLFLHNVMQIFVAADHRYRPLTTGPSAPRSPRSCGSPATSPTAASPWCCSATAAAPRSPPARSTNCTPGCAARSC